MTAGIFRAFMHSDRVVIGIACASARAALGGPHAAQWQAIHERLRAELDEASPGLAAWLEAAPSSAPAATRTPFDYLADTDAARRLRRDLLWKHNARRRRKTPW